MSVIKIVAIGPESTGKSTLCEQLARHYDTVWCPEYAREYLLQNGTAYTFDDLLEIARGQLQLEDMLARQVKPGRPFFIDTDMYVMKVWYEFVFGRCHPFVEEQLAQRKYDLYLLCNTDLPWVKDELREYPDLSVRQHLYHIYKNLMMGQSVPWVDISGQNSERLQKAINAVDQLIESRLCE
ncbi:MAG: AAA family ATPase [Chitinophagaceae bacterium]|nr:AAA family ATPase [Chitinophagaceae bacterium]